MIPEDTIVWSYLDFGEPGWEEFEGEVIYYHPGSSTTHYIDGVVATVIEVVMDADLSEEQIIVATARRLKVEAADVSAQVSRALRILEAIGIVAALNRVQ